VLNKIKDCFADRFARFKKEQEYTATYFVDDFISLSSKGEQAIRRDRSAVEALFDPQANKYSQLPLFERSRRILPKLYEKSSPLFKLKIIYEFNKEMSRETDRLRERLGKEHNIVLAPVFNRETELLIVRWVVGQLRSEIDRLAPHLLLTYFFLHPLYKVDRKGSCLTTFVQEIERITHWQQ
jgi:hypothetical protein